MLFRTGDEGSSGGRDQALGYAVKDRKLVVNKTEAATVRQMFEGFIDRLGDGAGADLREQGVCGKRGRLIDKGYVYQLVGCTSGRPSTRARPTRVGIRRSSTSRSGKRCRLFWLTARGGRSERQSCVCQPSAANQERIRRLITCHPDLIPIAP